MATAALIQLSMAVWPVPPHQFPRVPADLSRSGIPWVLTLTALLGLLHQAKYQHLPVRPRRCLHVNNADTCLGITVASVSSLLHGATSFLDLRLESSGGCRNVPRRSIIPDAPGGYGFDRAHPICLILPALGWQTFGITYF